MAITIWNGSTGDWGTGANWSTSSVPVSADDVIFDGRTAQAVTTGLDQTGVDLASMHIMSTYTVDIGTQANPLTIETNGTLRVEGTGNICMMCGNDAADADIVTTIVNQASGTFKIHSQKNASGQNISAWTDLFIQKGRVTAYGNADTEPTPAADAGCWIKNLYIVPAQGSGANVTMTIGDKCKDLKNSDSISIFMQAGTVTMDSKIKLLHLHGGTFTVGSDTYTMLGTDDALTDLYLYGGDFNWRPSDKAVKASPSPVITTARIFSGNFDASAMLETDSTAPTITTVDLYDGGVFNIKNGFANFIVTTLNNYGGQISVSQGQALTLT